MPQQKTPRKNWQPLLIPGIIVGAILFFGWICLFGWNRHQLYQNLTTDRQRLEASAETFKNINNAIGTLATIVGGIVLYLNFKTAKDNTKIAEDRLMTIGEKLKKKAKGNSPPS